MELTPGSAIGWRQRWVPASWVGGQVSLAMSAWDLDTQGPGCHDLKPTHPALLARLDRGGGGGGGGRSSGRRPHGRAGSTLLF